jgi:hypothetical protein
MAVPFGKRFPMEFDELFPEGAYVVGDVTAVTEYQSQEDKARNRPVRPRIDKVSGLPIYKVTIADPSAEKDRDKSITVEIASRVQPVPPAAVSGLPFRPVVLEGMTVQPRAETSGQRSGSRGLSAQPACVRWTSREAATAPTRNPSLPVPLMSGPLRHKGGWGPWHSR